MDLNTIKTIESYVKRKGTNIDKIDFLLYLDKLKENCKPIKKNNKKHKITRKIKVMNDLDIESFDIKKEIKFPSDYIENRFKNNIYEKVNDNSMAELKSKRKIYPKVSKFTGEIFRTQEDFLKSEHWRLVKISYNKINTTKKCEICGNTGEMHLHHLTYKNFCDENMNELIRVCKSCHSIIHNK